MGVPVGVPLAFPLASRWRSRWRPDGVPVGAARRGRRALPGGTPRRNVAGTGAWCSRGIRGRGRRPRRPASRRRPHGVPCARRAADVAPYQVARPDATRPARAHGVHGASVVVGADVPGGPRARGVPVGVSMASHARGAPGTSRPTRRYISFPLPFLPFPVSRNPVACDAAIVLHFIMRLRGTVYSSCPPEADAFFDLVDGTASTTALRSPRVA